MRFLDALLISFKPGHSRHIQQLEAYVVSVTAQKKIDKLFAFSEFVDVYIMSYQHSGYFLFCLCYGFPVLNFVLGKFQKLALTT